MIEFREFWALGIFLWSISQAFPHMMILWVRGYSLTGAAKALRGMEEKNNSKK